MKIELKCGFTCEVKDEAFDDYRVAKLLNQMQNGGASGTLAGMVGIITRVLGEDQEEELIAYLENHSENGIAKSSTMEDIIVEITEVLMEAKKNT